MASRRCHHRFAYFADAVCAIAAALSRRRRRGATRGVVRLAHEGRPRRRAPRRLCSAEWPHDRPRGEAVPSALTVRRRVGLVPTGSAPLAKRASSRGSTTAAAGRAAATAERNRAKTLRSSRRQLTPVRPREQQSFGGNLRGRSPSCGARRAVCGCARSLDRSEPVRAHEHRRETRTRALEAARRNLEPPASPSDA